MKAAEDIAALLAYVPLLFSDRMEKALLLEPFLREVMALTGRREVSSGDCDLYPTLIPLIPPQVVMELKGLRHADHVYLDFWEACVGKGKVDWRFLLVLEADHDKKAKAYLDMLLSRAAVKHDACELQLFAKAFEKIKQFRRGFAQPDKAKALQCYLRRRAEGRPIRAAKEIEYFLEHGPRFTGKGHNLARTREGPFWATLKAKKQADRPDGGNSSARAGRLRN